MIHIDRYKRKIHKRIAVLMTAICLIELIWVRPMDVYAQAAMPQTDEAMYINLDYYGQTSDISIVKGVSLNGKSDITDYGEYSKVVNMTSEVQPVITADGVSFSGLETDKRFYYQCTPKDNTSVEIPWTIDVSYKLNGVPTDADQLAGASGTIEEHIVATANPAASDYMKNNMLLTVATTVDMTKSKSVEAEGAQIQSLGTYDAVMWAALPGEDGDYTVRIGTDSFESTGIIIMMVPGTVDALNHVKDIKEAKDKITDSVDKIYDSTDQLLGIMGTMDSSLIGMRSGLANLNQARATIDSYGGTLEGQTDASIASLRDLANQTADMVPHINTAKQALNDITIDMDTIAGDVDDIRPTLSDLTSDMGSIQDDLQDLQDVLQDADSDVDDIKGIAGELYTKLNATSAKLSILQAILTGTGVLATASNGFGGVNYVTSMDASTQQLYAALLKLGYFDSLATPASAEQMSGYYQALQQQALSSDAMYKALGELCTEGQQYINLTQDSLIVGDGALGTVQDGIWVGNNTVDDVDGTLDHTQDALVSSKGLLQDIVDMNTTLDKYSQTSQDALTAAGTLTSSVDRTLVSTADTLTTIDNIFKNSRGNLNAGTKSAIESSIEAIDKALEATKLSGSFQDANKTAKDAWDDELDSIEDDTNFLNIDPEAGIVSLTSSKNDAPNSLQIILRTKEITDDDSTPTDVSDLETELTDAGPLKRMWLVFKNIWDYIVGVFSDL